MLQTFVLSSGRRRIQPLLLIDYLSYLTIRSSTVKNKQLIKSHRGSCLRNQNQNVLLNFYNWEFYFESFFTAVCISQLQEIS